MEAGLEGLDWIHVAHDSDQWQVLVGMIINLKINSELISFSPFTQDRSYNAVTHHPYFVK